MSYINPPLKYCNVDINSLMENFELEVKNDTVYNKIAEYFLGEDATYESILEIKEDILNESEDEKNLISSVLGVTKNHVSSYLKDSKSASILFRALRDKGEEMEDKLSRARAEERGFISTVIYTIKKILKWLMKKFADLKDDIMDSIRDRPAGASQAKRDYKWLKDHSDKWLEKNTDWYKDNEH